MKFDNNLAAIHGYLCADGYVIKSKNPKYKYYYIGLRNNNPVLLGDFQKRFFEYFLVMPQIKSDGRCVIQSKEIYSILSKDFSYYSRDWKIPSNLNQNQIEYWLRVFFDCEGWVLCIPGKNRHIGADSINKKGLFSIKESLKMLGINSKFKIIKNGQIYRLIIYGKDNLAKFDRQIGFLHPNKKRKMKSCLKSYRNLIWDLPNNKESIKKLLQDKSYNNRIRITPVKKENLIQLSKKINKFFGVNPKIIGPIKNNTTQYYELYTNRKLFK